MKSILAGWMSIQYTRVEAVCDHIGQTLPKCIGFVEVRSSKVRGRYQTRLIFVSHVLQMTRFYK